jgi:outer membrane protein OmpA-like peptidoglycan-associated protein
MFGNSSSARKHFARVGILAAVMLGSFGCATQTWVIETIREMDKELVARFEKDEAAAAAETVRVNGQLAEIRGIGVDARGRADRAQSTADGVNSRVTQVLANRLKRAPVVQLDITFETGKADINQLDRAALQALLPTIKDNPTYTVDIVGYTDTVGTPDYNVDLSWRREEAVRRYLAERGVELNRFFFIGVGEELSGDDVKDTAKRAKNRRVSITIFKPVD